MRTNLATGVAPSAGLARPFCRKPDQVPRGGVTEAEQLSSATCQPCRPSLLEPSASAIAKIFLDLIRK